MKKLAIGDCQLPIGLWSLVFGVRCLDFGVRSLDLGLWSLEYVMIILLLNVISELRPKSKDQKPN